MLKKLFLLYKFGEAVASLRLNVATGLLGAYLQFMQPSAGHQLTLRFSGLGLVNRGNMSVVATPHSDRNRATAVQKGSLQSHAQL